MKNFMNQLSAQRLKRLFSLALLLTFSASIMAPSAEARLIFTTEDDGVESDTYTLDVDGTVNTNDNTDLTLNFGANLSASITYNDSTDKFTINQDVDFGGNNIIDFRVESAATAGAPTCTIAGDAGRMYYDTDDNEMYVCTGVAGWDSVEDIASGGITSADIADGTITADDLGTGSVGSDEIIDGSIATADLADGSVTGGAGGVIADGSITADDLGTGSVDSDEIATDAVGSAEIAADAVGASEIATGAVTTDEILDGTIAAADLADGSVNGGVGGVITDGSITADDLGNGSVDSDEIATDAVGSAEIAADAVGASEIATGAVTTDEILDGTIATVDLANNSVDGTKLSFTGETEGDISYYDGTDWITLGIGTAGQVLTTNGAADAPEWAAAGSSTLAGLSDTNFAGLAAGNIMTFDGTEWDNVAMSGDGTVNATGVFDLAADSVGSAEIAADAVGASEIATGAVTTDEILDGTIATADIAAGAITGGLAGVIADGSITSDDLGTNSVDSDEIAADAVGASEIATGAVTTDEILDGTITAADLANRDFTDVVPPEFPNFTITADGSDNRGTLQSDYDAGNNRNYYEWFTRRSTLQDYDLVVQWPVPADFVDFQAANPIQFDYQTTNATSTDNQIDVVSILDTAGAAMTLTGDTADLATAAWTTASVDYTGTPTFTAGQFITLNFRLHARNNGSNTNAFLGALKFNYQAK